MENSKTRRWLLTAAGGIVTVGSMSRVGSAKGGPPDHANGKGKGNKNGNGNGNGNNGKRNRGPPADAKNTCPEDAAMLAKYEVEGGEFVYEKDSDYLEAGDAFEFSVTETKDGDEVLAFEVTDPEGVYDIYTLSVKTGDGVFRKEIDDTSGEFNAAEFDDSPPVQAISNVTTAIDDEHLVTPCYRAERGSDAILFVFGQEDC